VYRLSLQENRLSGTFQAPFALKTLLALEIHVVNAHLSYMYTIYIV